MSKKTDNDYNEGIELWHKVVETVKAYSVDKLVTKSTPSTKSTLVRKKVRPAKKRPVVSRVAPTQKTNARIDLHGMTQEEAFEALNNFIPNCVHRNKKTAIVITGKGKDSTGVLKRAVPLWLEGNKFKRYIKSVSIASPQQGGAGALLVKFK